MKRIHPALLLLGVVLFGLLTFAAGLILGLGLQQSPSQTAPPADAGHNAVPPAPAALPASGSPAMPPSPTLGAPTGIITAPGVTGVPAPAIPEPAVPAQSPPAVPTAPPPGPVVKGLRSDATQGGGGQSGSLVLQAKALAGHVLEPETTSDRIISVEVGRFLLVENAVERAAALTQLGFATELVTASYPGMPAWHVVTLGALPDERTARDLAMDASTRTGLSAQVVSWQRPAS